MDERFQVSGVGFSIEGEKDVLQNLVGVVLDGREPSDKLLDLVGSLADALEVDGPEKATLPLLRYDRRMERVLRRVDEKRLCKDSALSVGFDRLSDGRESIYVDLIYDTGAKDHSLRSTKCIFEAFAVHRNVSFADCLVQELVTKYNVCILGDQRKVTLDKAIQSAEQQKNGKCAVIHPRSIERSVNL